MSDLGPVSKPRGSQPVEHESPILLAEKAAIGKCADILKQLKLVKDKTVSLKGYLSVFKVVEGGLKRALKASPAQKHLQKIGKELSGKGVGESYRTLREEMVKQMADQYRNLLPLIVEEYGRHMNLTEFGFGHLEEKNVDVDAEKEMATFLEEVIALILDHPARKEEVGGCVWKIEDDEGVAGYLVGTCHFADKAMVDNPLMQKALALSDSLVTETGEAGLQFLEEHSELKRNPGGGFDLHMDNELIKLAKKSQKSVFPLESINDNISAVEVLEKRSSKGWETLKKRSLDEKLAGEDRDVLREKVQFFLALRKLDSALTIDAWRSGKEGFYLDCVSAQEEIVENNNYFFEKRTKKWLTQPELGILEHLEYAEQPVCIAVGAGHCFSMKNSRGLVELLQGEGFKVTRVRDPEKL